MVRIMVIVAVIASFFAGSYLSIARADEGLALGKMTQGAQPDGG